MPERALTLLGQRAAALTPAVQKLMEQVARETLLPRFGTLSREQIEEKSRGEVVTVADREAEIALTEGLAALLPEAAIVGEEASHANPALHGALGSGLCWIVDPLDGTANFAAGQGPFGIMIALAAEGRTAGGWILDPVSGRFSTATCGGGAWIDGQRVRGTNTHEARQVVALSSLLRTRPKRFEEVVRRLSPNYDLIDIPRCAADHYPAMLLGSCDATLYERTLAWDHAPGVLLVEEAGGHCARLDGAPYRLDDGRTGLLVADSAEEWERIAALLEDLPE